MKGHNLRHPCHAVALAKAGHFCKKSHSQSSPRSYFFWVSSQGPWSLASLQRYEAMKRVGPPTEVTGNFSIPSNTSHRSEGRLISRSVFIPTSQEVNNSKLLAS